MASRAGATENSSHAFHSCQMHWSAGPTCIHRPTTGIIARSSLYGRRRLHRNLGSRHKDSVMFGGFRGRTLNVNTAVGTSICCHQSGALRYLPLHGKWQVPAKRINTRVAAVHGPVSFLPSDHTDSDDEAPDSLKRVGLPRLNNRAAGSLNISAAHVNVPAWTAAPEPIQDGRKRRDVHVAAGTAATADVAHESGDGAQASGEFKQDNGDVARDSGDVSQGRADVSTIAQDNGDDSASDSGQSSWCADDGGLDGGLDETDSSTGHGVSNGRRSLNQADVHNCGEPSGKGDSRRCNSDTDRSVESTAEGDASGDRTSSPVFPASEKEQAERISEQLGFNHPDSTPSSDIAQNISQHIGNVAGSGAGTPGGAHEPKGQPSRGYHSLEVPATEKEQAENVSQQMGFNHPTFTPASDIVWGLSQHIGGAAANINVAQSRANQPTGQPSKGHCSPKVSTSDKDQAERMPEQMRSNHQQSTSSSDTGRHGLQSPSSDADETAGSCSKVNQPEGQQGNHGIEVPATEEEHAEKMSEDMGFNDPELAPTGQVGPNYPGQQPELLDNTGQGQNQLARPLLSLEANTHAGIQQQEQSMARQEQNQELAESLVTGEMMKTLLDAGTSSFKMAPAIIWALGDTTAASVGDTDAALNDSHTSRTAASAVAADRVDPGTAENGAQHSRHLARINLNVPQGTATVAENDATVAGCKHSSHKVEITGASDAVDSTSSVDDDDSVGERGNAHAKPTAQTRLAANAMQPMSTELPCKTAGSEASHKTADFEVSQKHIDSEVHADAAGMCDGEGAVRNAVSAATAAVDSSTAADVATATSYDDPLLGQHSVLSWPLAAALLDAVASLQGQESQSAAQGKGGNGLVNGGSGIADEVAQALEGVAAELSVIHAREERVDTRLDALEREIVELSTVLRSMSSEAKRARSTPGLGASASQAETAIVAEPDSSNVAAEVVKQRQQVGLFDINKLQSKITQFMNSGYFESVKQVRAGLMLHEWELNLKRQAMLKGVADFERYCGENDIEVDDEVVRTLYENPDDLQGVPKGRLRLLARSMIQQAMSERMETVYKECTEIAREMSKLGIGDMAAPLTGDAGILGLVKSLLPFKLPFTN